MKKCPEKNYHEIEKLKYLFDNATSKYVEANGWPEDSMENKLFAIYVNMFKEVPSKISFYNYASYMKEHLTVASKCDKCVNKEDEQDEKYEDVIPENTFLNVIKYLEDNNMTYINVRFGEQPIILTASGDMLYYTYSIMLLTREDDIPQYIKDSLVFPTEDGSTYEYMSYTKDGFDTMTLQIKNVDIDLEKNYNDDIPYDEIVDFLESDESGLILLHGTPGTGKSMLLRHLITNIDRDFVYLDSSAFDSITDSSFIKTLAEYENGVLILEDCENMLTGRLDGNNKLAALLNLTDGLLGDSFKFKIICTFNAELGKIDKALTRKGRLKIKYEFKELSLEKTKALAESIGKDIKNIKKMTLADIYGYGEVVDKSAKEEKTIGFI